MDYEDRQNLLNGPHAKESLPEETVDHVTTFHRNESPVSNLISLKIRFLGNQADSCSP
jgi:hypothetical protein